MKRIVIAEGVVEVERTDFPCVHTDGYCNVLRPSLTGLFKRKDGWTNIAYLEHALEAMNGKKIRVVFEKL